MATTVITPSKAEEWLLVYNIWPGQRTISKPKVLVYKELILDGRMRPVDVSFATGPDGAKYLVNGQHVLSACVESGKEMRAVVSYYKCDTAEDMWHLFASFDVHPTRTQIHVIKAAQGLMVKDIREVPLRVLQQCGSALFALSRGIKFGYEACTDKALKVDLINNNPVEVAWVSTFTSNMRMLRVGAVAAMIATYRKHPEQADEYWRQVESGLGFTSRTDPQKKTRDLLLGCTNRTPNSAMGHKRVYSICISWWNSWITNTPRRSVKFESMNEVPEVM